LQYSVMPIKFRYYMTSKILHSWICRFICSEIHF